MTKSYQALGESGLCGRGAWEVSCWARPVSFGSLIYFRLAVARQTRRVPDWRRSGVTCHCKFLDTWKVHLRTGNARALTSYYSISNRFKFTVVSLHDKVPRFAANSPSWVTFGRHHSLLLALCSLDNPILSLCCCSLVSPPRRSCLGSRVHRCVVILAWNYQFVFDLGKIQLEIVTHELLPSIFIVEENVLAYILLRLVALGNVN